MNDNLVIDHNQIVEHSRKFIVDSLNKNGCTLTAFIFGLFLGVLKVIDDKSGGRDVSRSTHLEMVLKFYRTTYFALADTSLSSKCASNIKRSLEETTDEDVNIIMDIIYDSGINKYKTYKTHSSKCPLL